MTYVHQCGKVDFFFSSLCASRKNLFLALDFFQIPCRYCLELFPFLVHCGFCILNFHRLWHRNKLVHQVVMCHRSKSFACNVVFMIFGLRREDSSRCCVDSRGSTLQPYTVLEHFSDAISGFAATFVMILGGLLHGLAGVIGIFENFFVFFVIRIGKVNSSQSSSIVELRFLFCH